MVAAVRASQEFGTGEEEAREGFEAVFGPPCKDE